MSHTVLYIKDKIILGIEDFNEKPDEQYCRDVRDSLGADYFDISRKEDDA